MKKILHLDPPSGYNAHAPYYDQKLSYLDTFEQDKFLPLLGDIKNKKILDIGAGTGRLSLRLDELEASITAVDISPKILKILHKKNQRIKTVVADAESLPFPDASFDIVTAAFLIVHLKEPKYFFAASQRVLRKNGWLAITNVNQKRPPMLDSDQGKITIESYYHRPEKIIQLLEDLGFRISKNIFVEENGTWINQIILAEK